MHLSNPLSHARRPWESAFAHPHKLSTSATPTAFALLNKEIHKHRHRLRLVLPRLHLRAPAVVVMMNTPKRNPMRRTRALDARQFRALLAHPAMRTVLLSDDEMSTVTVENSNPAANNININNNTASPAKAPAHSSNPPTATAGTVTKVASVTSVSSILTSTPSSNASSTSSSSLQQPPTPADPAH